MTQNVTACWLNALNSTHINNKDPNRLSRSGTGNHISFPSSHGNTTHSPTKAMTVNEAWTNTHPAAYMYGRHNLWIQISNEVRTLLRCTEGLAPCSPARASLSGKRSAQQTNYCRSARQSSPIATIPSTHPPMMIQIFTYKQADLRKPIDPLFHQTDRKQTR